MGHWIELTADDGVTITAWRADPPGKPRGGLVVVQEIFGVNSHIRGVCEGYAADGYLVVAPALFDRVSPRVDLGYTQDDIERGRALKAKAALEPALRDVDAAHTAVAPAGKVGVIGYCWGGYVTWMSAARLAGVACAVPYYGGGMLEAVSERPRCPVLAHFGEKDAMIPADGVRKFAAAHPDAEVHLYPANHGFNCEQRASYDAPSAKLARERTLAFLHKHVG